MRRTLLAVAVLLIAIPLVVGREDAPAPSTPVATIAERVEKLRGLTFEELPKPERVDGAQAKRDGLADFDKHYPLAARRADETLYKLLRLLPEDADLKAITGSLFGEGVAGYYDPRTKALKIVEGAGTANQVLDEMVVAHELNHALEDAAIGLDQDTLTARDDRGYAGLALVEGTATAVMFEYVGRHFDSSVALGGLLSSAFLPDGTAGLPDFTVAGLVFPYLGGQRFVETLYRRAGNRWTLVDLAQRTRPPTTTEQVLHPEKWIDAEETVAVRTPGAPGQGWRLLTQGTFGEWQTNQLIEDRRAAEGWGGDRYALHAKGAQRRLAMRWRFDTPQDVEEFAPALRAAARDLPGARVARAGGEVSLVVTSTA